MRYNMNSLRNSYTQPHKFVSYIKGYGLKFLEMHVKLYEVLFNELCFMFLNWQNIG